MSPFGLLRPTEIKEMRNKLGLTQAKLAELSGVTQAYIAKIEAGEADPRISTLERVIKALEVYSVRGPAQTVEKIMTSPTISVKPTDTVEKAMKLMEKQNMSQLPVIDVNSQVGSISETTLLHLMSSGDKFSGIMKKRISEVMEEPFPMVAKDEDVDVIYHLLGRRSAVLVSDRGRIVGIVTKADLFKLRGSVEQNLSPPKIKR